MKRNITRILVILAIILNISFLCSCVPSVTKVKTKMNKANYKGERIYYDDLITFDEAGNKNYTFGKNIRNANYIYFFNNNDNGFTGYTLETFRTEHLFVLYFQSKTDAEDFLTGAQKAVNLIVKDLEEQRNVIKETSSEDSDEYKKYSKAIRNLKNYTFKVSNKCAYLGTADIASAFAK